MQSLPLRLSVHVAVVLTMLVGGASFAGAQPAKVSAATQTPPPANNCLTCHAKEKDTRLSQPTVLFSDVDVHRESGFACVNCHGGNAAGVDQAAGHDKAHGFKGKPAGKDVIATCASCHADATLMHKYAPKQRVDQALEYATSVHGQLLAKGDDKVATCVNCHGAHGIRMVKDAKSPVFPSNVASTCGACHADPKHMAGYTIAGGAPLPTNQFAEYRKSVHYETMTKRNDLSAPTCNDCHGNHGAAPPGVGNVANVCGTCHAVFATKFDSSVHHEIFDRGCVECHGNHDVEQPSDELLGSSPKAICSTCHSGKDDEGAIAADHMRASIERLKSGIAASAATVAKIKNASIEVSAEESALDDARAHLTLARTEMHTANQVAMDKVIDEGLGILKDVDKAGEEGEKELQFRRRGLAASLAAILLLVVALAMKVRQIDKKNPH